MKTATFRLHTASLLQAMRSTGHAWSYKAWCSAVISCFSTALIGVFRPLLIRASCFIRSRMTSRPHCLRKTSSMQSKRHDLHHTWLHRETNEKLSFYCYSPRWITTTFSTKLMYPCFGACSLRKFSSSFRPKLLIEMVKCSLFKFFFKISTMCRSNLFRYFCKEKSCFQFRAGRRHCEIIFECLSSFEVSRQELKKLYFRIYWA